MKNDGMLNLGPPVPYVDETIVVTQEMWQRWIAYLGVPSSYLQPQGDTARAVCEQQEIVLQAKIDQRRH